MCTPNDDKQAKSVRISYKYSVLIHCVSLLNLGGWCWRGGSGQCTLELLMVRLGF
jgi:hypothetical protein